MPFFSDECFYHDMFQFPAIQNFHIEFNDFV